MDDIDNLEAQISYLQEDIGQRLQLLNEDQSTVQFKQSTPKPIDSETERIDSGIVTTRSQKSHQTAQGRTEGIVEDESRQQTTLHEGARPKTTKMNTASLFAEMRNEDDIMSPIVQPSSMPQATKVTFSEDVKNDKKIKSYNRRIKLANYDGTGEWRDYKSHFDACAAINDWDDEEKGLYLPAALRGQAQCVLGDLPSDRQVHYTSLVEALEERFAPPNQMDLYRVQLKERRQKASETLPELGQAIRRLVNKAYPKAPAEVRETLSTEHFLDSLVNSEMRIRIKQSRPSNLNEAICLAVELDALYKAEKKNEFGRAHPRGATGADETKRYKDNKEDKLVGMMQAFNKKLDDLQKDLEKVKRNQAECFKCGQKDHWKRECKEQQKRRPQTEETPIKYAARHLRTRRRKHSVTRNVRTWELILLTRKQECTST